MKAFKITTAAAAFALMANASFAATEISWWHAMGGHLGEVVNEISTGYNASQDACSLTPVYKGGYEDTLTAGIAAFRAGEQNSSIDYILPTTLGSQGDILSIASINGTTATLSWVSSQGTPSSIATNDAVANDPALVAKLVEELRRSTEELEATRALLERALDQLDAAAKTGSPAESR